MTRFVLSTMYAQTARFDDGAEFARFAQDAGYDAIEISHSTPAEKIEAIHAANILPIASVHQPAPLRQVGGRPNSNLNLAAIDEDERKLAVSHTLDSIRLAGEVGADAVIVHLGHLGGTSRAWAGDREARRLFAAGTPHREAAGRALAVRLADAPPYLKSARKTLAELVEVASPLGVTLGLESRLNLPEFPLPSELPALVDGYTPEQVGYWHDVGHAEVLWRMGYIDRFDWFREPGVRCAGAHVHDVTQLTDHRAPGAGDVELAEHARHLSGLDAVTLEINQHQPEEQVRMTIPLLRSLGF